MRDSWLLYLLLIAICLAIQGFFAMIEMACVSFNKVRLEYYVSKGKKRAVWLSFLLHHPAYLFGTTLIGVNTALIVGSECARRFWATLGFSPDIAALTQIFLVLIFAEIAPMFAGRRYAEHVAMLCIPILYFFSVCFRPIIWGLDGLCKVINRLIGKKVPPGVYLSREELQNIIEERDEGGTKNTFKEFNTIVSHIFSLKNKTAKDLMQPLSEVTLVPSFCTVGEMRALSLKQELSFLPIFHRNVDNIIAIAYPRDLLRQSETKRLREFARTPWFIAENSSILQLLKQFRKNNQSIAVVLSQKGLATGILSLDEIIDEIFGQTDDEWMSYEERLPRAEHILVDRTFTGDTSLKDFNQQFSVHLVYQDAQTLEEVMTQILGHPPSKGESVRIDHFELAVEEAPLIGPMEIRVRTVF